MSQVRYRCRHADGRWLWIQRRATPFQRDDEGEVTHVLGVLRDVTDVVEVEERLRHGATHDPLTGLPNRALLSERVRRAVTRREPVALVYLDLDGFKRVNDTSGHATGDLVLQEVARRLAAAVGPQDTVARLGGDEFVLLLEGRSPAAAAAAAEQALAVVAVPVAAGGTTHLVTASAGLVLTGDQTDVDRLLADADTAMYRSKGLGKARLTVFESSLREDLLERLRVERVLRAALVRTAVPSPRGQPLLTLAYQVVVEGDGTVAGVEALARLTDDAGAAVPPDVFVSVAEESDLVRTLGARVLDAALRQLAAWRAESAQHRHLTMAVNVSAREVREPSFAADVTAALRRHELDPADLVLELDRDGPARGRRRHSGRPAPPARRGRADRHRRLRDRLRQPALPDRAAGRPREGRPHLHRRAPARRRQHDGAARDRRPRGGPRPRLRRGGRRDAGAAGGAARGRAAAGLPAGPAGARRRRSTWPLVERRQGGTSEEGPPCRRSSGTRSPCRPCRRPACRHRRRRRPSRACRR